MSLTDAIQALRAERRRLQQDLARVESALATLTDNGPVRTSTPRKKRRKKPTVRSVIVSILSDAPDQTFTTSEVLVAIGSGDYGLEVVDLRNSTYSALSRLAEDGTIDRVGEGLYRWSSPTSADSDVPPLQREAEPNAGPNG